MDDRLGMDQYVDLRRVEIEEPVRFDDLSPLFIIVAESMVILAPIDQLG